MPLYLRFHQENDAIDVKNYDRQPIYFPFEESFNK